jgi:hypothetical protein
MSSEAVKKPKTLAELLENDAYKQIANAERAQDAKVNAPLSSAPATDLIESAAKYVQPYLDCSIPVSDRVRNLWAAIVAARDMGASDVIEREFMRLAHDTGLARDLGRHADEDLRHVIRLAMLGRNPFQ